MAQDMPDGSPAEAPQDAAAAPAPDTAPGLAEPGDGGAAPSAPDATKAAAEHAAETGVDLSQVEGSGTGGRILKDDVVAAAAAQDGGDASDAEREREAAALAERNRRSDCPNCHGKADQDPGTPCRECGTPMVETPGPGES